MAEPITYWLRQDGRLWMHRDSAGALSAWVRVLRGPRPLLHHLQEDFSGRFEWRLRAPFEEDSAGGYDVDYLLDLDRRILCLDPIFLLADHGIADGYARSVGQGLHFREALSSSPVWMKAVEELLLSTDRWNGWSIAFLKRCSLLAPSEVARLAASPPDLIYRLDDLPGDNPAEQIFSTHHKLRQLILALSPALHGGLEEVQNDLRRSRPRWPVL